MNLVAYLKEIRKKGRRYFTLSQLLADNETSKSAALNAIARLRKNGDLISPARGLYIIVPPENQELGCIPPEELVPILMKYMKEDYYVSVLSGAQYHGASHQRPGQFQIISNKRIKHPLEFGQVKIDVLYKKSLKDLPMQEVVVKTGILKIASPELVALDLFLYLGRSGGLNHVATVLSELVEELDAEKLLILADQIQENSWLQRLGYILDQLETMVPEKTKELSEKIESYLKNKMKVFVPLASEIPRSGFPRVKKWMIIANTTIESDL